MSENRTGNHYRPEGTRLHTAENRAWTADLDTMERAMQEGAILEGVAVKAHGAESLQIELGGYLAQMDRDEVQYSVGPIKDIAVITRVGKPVCFKILSIERPKVGAPIIRLSRLAAQAECAAQYLAKLRPGDVILAKVTHLEHFGAFVDIGCGIISLLSIDCISVSRISHPSDRLHVGMELSVIVRDMERDENGIPTRIYVTRKELLGSWEENAALFSVGQTVTGIVRSVEMYGIFVELTPNLAGLAEYRGDVSVGQCAAVYIKSILPERMKIKLVIVDSYHGIASMPTPSLSERTHIDRWQYSPCGSNRLIETVFDERD